MILNLNKNKIAYKITHMISTNIIYKITNFFNEFNII